jgi:Arc/MetJ-type ribon-helix-helix transcriptional regulator
MGKPQHLEITISDETLEFLQREVASGEFGSVSQVIEESLQIYREQSEEMGRWEREVVIPEHDRIMADPSSAIPIDEVIRTLATRRRERQKAS